MTDHIQHFIEFLQKNIKDWEEAAQFCEKQVYSLQALGEREGGTGKQEAEKYRARIAEQRELIAQLKGKVAH